MNWKHWPYWLRGGVIGGVFVLVSSILSFSCLYLFTSPGSWGLGCVPFEIPWIPFWFIPNFTSLPVISYEVVVAGGWFFFGSLIGALVGYVKSKKKIT